MIAKQASAMSMSELTLSLLQRDQPEIWHYLDQMPHSTPRAGLLYQVAKKVSDQLEGSELILDDQGNHLDSFRIIWNHSGPLGVLYFTNQ